MNIENIKIVRDHIASLPPEQFTMEYFSGDSPCGTAACIAGWTNLLLGDGNAYRTSQAAEILGLTDDDRHELFWIGGRPDTDPLWQASPAQGAAVLDHLMTTGKVDWSVAAQVVA